MDDSLSPQDRRRLARHELLQEFSLLRTNHTIAVLLCFFAGFSGAHRWYVGHKIAALIMGGVWMFLLIGIVINFMQLDKIRLENWLDVFRPYGIFVAIESALIFRSVEKKNAKLRLELESKYYE